MSTPRSDIILASQEHPRHYSSLPAQMRLRMPSLYAEDVCYDEGEDDNPTTADDETEILLEFPSPPSSTTSHSSCPGTPEVLFPRRDTYNAELAQYTSETVLQGYGSLFRSAHLGALRDELVPPVSQLPPTWLPSEPWPPLNPKRRVGQPPTKAPSCDSHLGAKDAILKHSHVHTTPKHSRMSPTVGASPTPHDLPSSPIPNIAPRVDRRRQALILKPDEAQPETPQKLWLHRAPQSAPQDPPPFERTFPDPPQIVQCMRLIHRAQAQRQFGARHLSTSSCHMKKNPSFVDRLREVPFWLESLRRGKHIGDASASCL
ncbi:hypothetical protein K488DRAFT_82918 [Vararia minispora EC-137]|uniref:Uncharacterized protein n=1 Tax=Vararia minispora EC-137 TaxID=1314806 RepID=A0ACB8QW91_9AGAM|nr:hypothetical protein K488DRAFT_82918 [Vararia minispora EC-137]